jgi:hypothetical protein
MLRHIFATHTHFDFMIKNDKIPYTNNNNINNNCYNNIIYIISTKH